MDFSQFKCPLSAQELQDVHNNMMLEADEWVRRYFPRISLAVFERNLGTILHLKRQDDACKKCCGPQMCPTQDANRMQGMLMSDGIISIWMEPCPQGFRPPRATYESEDPKPRRGWSRGG